MIGTTSTLSSRLTKTKSTSATTSPAKFGTDASISIATSTSCFGCEKNQVANVKMNKDYCPIKNIQTHRNCYDKDRNNINNDDSHCSCPKQEEGQLSENEAPLSQLLHTSDYNEETDYDKEHEELGEDDTKGHDFIEEKISQKMNLVQLCGVSSMPCGYCQDTNDCTSNIGWKNKKKSVSYGLFFERLHALDYLKLLNEGWRRSGKYLYKPYNDQSCCPCYSIRLPLSSFKPNKNQRKIQKRIQNLLSPQPSSLSQNMVSSLTVPTNNNRMNNGNKHIQNSVHGSKCSSWITELLSFKSHEIQQAIHEIMDPELLSSLFRSPTTQCTSGKFVEAIDNDPVQSKVKTKKNNKSKKSKSLSSLCQFHLWKSIPKQYFQQYKNKTSQIPSFSPLSIDNYDHIHNHTGRLCMVASTNVAIALTHMSIQEKRQQNRASENNQKNPMYGTHNNKENTNAIVQLANSILRVIAKNTSSVSSPTTYVDGKYETRKNARFSLHVHPFTGQIHLWVYQAPNESIPVTTISLLDDDNKNIQENLNKVKKSKTINSKTPLPYDLPLKNTIATDKSNRGSTCTDKLQDILGKHYSPSSPTTKSRSIPKNDGERIPRFYMSVEHIPSHKSARQPDVHRLFCRYQSIIHGDKDPYLLKNTKKRVSVPFTQDNTSATNDIVMNCCRRKRKQQHHEDDEILEPHHPQQLLKNCSIQQDDYDIREDDYKYDEDTMLPNTALTLDDIHVLYAKTYSKKQRNAIYTSYSSFFRFLCESPIPSVSSATNHDDEKRDKMEGCFHFHYYIHDSFENKKHLMAVGVLDILPSCISSVYAFYDPELSQKLELGKLTALYEIQWAKEHQHHEELQHYYLGYYIHSCIKMKYKAQFKPSQLLCCTHYKWIDFDEAKNKIEQFLPNYLPSLYHSPSMTTSNSLTSEGERMNIFPYPEKEGAYIHQTTSKHDEDKKYKTLDELFLDIGGPSIIQASVLSYRGRSMVNPLLREFCEQVCSYVGKRSIIKLSD